MGYTAEIRIDGLTTISPDEQKAVSNLVDTCMEPLAEGISMLFGERSFIVSMVNDKPVPPALGK